MVYLPGNLKHLRKLKGLTAHELGVGVNTARANITNWENSVSKPDVMTLSRIANYFGITIDDLLNKDLSGEEVINMVEEENIRYGWAGKEVDLKEIKQSLAGIEALMKLIYAKLDGL